MQKIELPWEIKNLGVRSVEYRFDGSDNLSEIDREVFECKEIEYQVCRIKSSNMDLVYLLQKNGYMFSETAFSLIADLKDYSFPVVYKQLLDNISYCESNNNDLSIIIDSIKKGVFNTDRIALDPYFSLDLSANRYSNWLSSEINSGNAKCYTVKYADKCIGFFALKNLSSIKSDSFLAALFDNKNAGLGFSVLLCPILQAKKEGKHKISARVSSNNLSSLKQHLALGYRIKDIDYVLIRHN